MRAYTTRGNVEGKRSTPLHIGSQATSCTPLSPIVNLTLIDSKGLRHFDSVDDYGELDTTATTCEKRKSVKIAPRFLCSDNSEGVSTLINFDELSAK